MYSSSMRKARLLTVSQHALRRGGVSAKGVCQGCLPRGVCPGGWQTPPCEQNDRQV